jgi:phosphoribosylanthranilate isomerase
VRVQSDAPALLRRDGSRRVRIKVCCIASPEEATLALRAGADALGLVSAMPSGPGVIPDDAIDTVVTSVGSRAATVLLTSRQDAAGIAAQLRRVRPTIVQIVDAFPTAEYEALRRSQPDVALMQVIHVRDSSAVEQAFSVAPHVDAILLDSGNPAAVVKELGGTGRVHDWAISRAIRDAVDVPVFVAGGLRASNVAEAISTVQPFGVDVCSGVRVRGALDPDALHAFIDAVRSAT